MNNNPTPDKPKTAEEYAIGEGLCICDDRLYHNNDDPNCHFHQFDIAEIMERYADIKSRQKVEEAFELVKLKMIESQPHIGEDATAQRIQWEGYTKCFLVYVDAFMSVLKDLYPEEPKPDQEQA